MRIWARASLVTAAAAACVAIASPPAAPTPPSSRVPPAAMQLSTPTGWVVRDTGVAELRVKYRCAPGYVAVIRSNLRQSGDELSSPGTTNQAPMICDGVAHTRLFTFLGFYEYQAFYSGPATYEI